jgi:RNA polymerase sigma factor (sigma-70 family)
VPWGSVPSREWQSRRLILGLSEAEEDDGFEEWYLSQFSRLVSVLIGLGADRQDAADIAAEAFSRALQRWDSVRQLESPSGWVYRVALNLFHRHGRRKALERRALLRSTPVAQDRDITHVWDAVSRLPRRQKTAIVLRYLVDLPYSEIASVMGIKEGTVAATLSAARRNLETALTDWEGR